MCVTLHVLKREYFLIISASTATVGRQSCTTLLHAQGRDFCCAPSLKLKHWTFIRQIQTLSSCNSGPSPPPLPHPARALNTEF